MSLAEQLRARTDASAARADPDQRRIIEADVEAVDASALAERALGLGEPAPDFELPSAHGTAVASADLLADGPLVVSFYRGGWCPYCVLELRELQRRYHDVVAAGAALVAVSPQTPAASLATVKALDLSYPVLADVGNRVAGAFGLVHRLSPGLVALYRDVLGRDLSRANDQAPDAWELPLPATFVLDRDGVVAFRFVTADYTQRAEPDDVIAALEAAAGAGQVGPR